VFADDWPELVAYVDRRATEGDHDAATREPGKQS
jgi:hypothetical protein